MGTLRADERKNLLRLPYSACPLQVISVSCCPPVPQILVSTGVTVSLLLASWLSAPAPLAGKVHKLLLSPPTLLQRGIHPWLCLLRELPSRKGQSWTQILSLCGQFGRRGRDTELGKLDL